MRVRLPLALAASAVVIGAILLSAGQERRASSTRSAEGWSAVRVNERPFKAGERRELAERLYGWNCMPCHGPEGKGDGPVAARLGLRPRDFSRGLFQLKSSHPEEMPFDEDLYRSISAGFPQGAMPPFADFSPEERWALVDHVKALTGPHFQVHPARRRVSDAPLRRDARRGVRLFGVGCAPCHGAGGRGDGAAAPGLLDADQRPAALPEFVRGELSFKGGARAEDVYRVLTTGLAGTAMPSFASLPERDRGDLAEFVACLQEPARPGEKLYLTRGCTQCHTIGKGRRIGPDLAGLSARRSRDWLRRWLENPPAMMATDDQAKAMAREYPVPMPNLNLTADEVSALADYLLEAPGR